MKLHEDILAQICEVANASTPPPKDTDFLGKRDIASLVLMLDENGVPIELYPSEVKFDLREVSNIQQLTLDATLFANARNYILLLLDHIMELENEKKRLALVARGELSPYNLEEDLAKLMEA